MERKIGISNREPAEAEDRERREHPPIDGTRRHHKTRRDA